MRSSTMIVSLVLPRGEAVRDVPADATDGRDQPVVSGRARRR